jgi:hypothetical protein
MKLSYRHYWDITRDLKIELPLPLLEYLGVHEKGNFSQIMITKEKYNYGGSNHLLSSVDFPVNNKMHSQGSLLIYGVV